MSHDATPPAARPSLNAGALALVEACLADATALGIAAHTLDTGTRVVDFGIDVAGSDAAGVALACICMGDAGTVTPTTLDLGGRTWPALGVSSAQPVRACMAAQYAGWAVTHGRYFAMGSGPLRAIARVERELFDRLHYAEPAGPGVLVLETRTQPSSAVAEMLAAKAGIGPEQLTLCVAPTASVAGTRQVVARIVETGLHKMDVLGFDLSLVIDAHGTAPVPPVAPDDLTAIGWTNDCVLYGGTAAYTVRADDPTLAALAPRLPSSASPDHGTPFAAIFARYDRDFYRIDPRLFSPAAVVLTSSLTGRSVTAGAPLPTVLEASFGAAAARDRN